MNQMQPHSVVLFTSGMLGGISERVRQWAMVRDPVAVPNMALIFVMPEKATTSPKFKGEMEKLNN